MRLNFDTKYLFSYNDLSKTIFNNYSKEDVIFVQEEHINYMCPFHIEQCEFRRIGGLIRAVPCEKCTSYNKCNDLKDAKDIYYITVHTAIIKNPKTNDIDIASLNELDFKLYSNYRVWKNTAKLYSNKMDDIEMSKKIDSFLEYGDFL